MGFIGDGMLPQAASSETANSDAKAVKERGMVELLGGCGPAGAARPAADTQRT
jgi:hypothetical protein